MKTITAIEVQRGNQQRVNVHLEGRFAFSLDALLAAERNLAIGQPLSEEELLELTGRDEFQRCYDAALRFLGYRPRSTAEVKQRLRKRGFGEDIVDAVLRKLKERQFLDDAAFARFWLENRQSFSPRGERLLRLELRQKGVDPETIRESIEGNTREAIDGLTKSLDEPEAAYSAAQKKARSFAADDYQKFRQRLGAFLQRRGFSYDTISDVVARLWRERQATEH